MFSSSLNFIILVDHFDRFNINYFRFSFILRLHFPFAFLVQSLLWIYHSLWHQKEKTSTPICGFCHSHLWLKFFHAPWWPSTRLWFKFIFIFRILSTAVQCNTQLKPTSQSHTFTSIDFRDDLVYSIFYCFYFMFVYHGFSFYLWSFDLEFFFSLFIYLRMHFRYLADFYSILKSLPSESSSQYAP